MSLYSSLSIKEWLAIHCATDEVDELFRKALKNNAQPMAVLALAELIKRGDIDLVTYAIREATDAGYITPGTHFSTVFTNALTNFGSRDPVLRRISKTVRVKGYWPKSAAELIGVADSAKRGSSEVRSSTRTPDNRLNEFLESFQRKGWFSIEFGFFVRSIEWDQRFKEHIIANSGEHHTLTIKDGIILNREVIPNVLGVLDDAGIADPLPKFEGEELYFYALEGGKWVRHEDVKGDNNFYVTYYSVD